MNEEYITGKPRRTCPVLTGWAGSFTKIKELFLEQGVIYEENNERE
jgi:hypothetical protein